MNRNFIQGLFALALIVLLVLLTDPFMYFMPPAAGLVILFIVVLLVGVWTGSVIREVPGDERAILHSMQAGRIAYVSGTLVLTAAVLYGGLVHHVVQTEIALALGVMVIAKIIAQYYFDTYK